MTQTILGSGGAIGTELAKALSSYTNDIRLVSRNPKTVNSSDNLLSADLTSPEEVLKAVEGSSVEGDSQTRHLQGQIGGSLDGCHEDSDP